MAEKLSPPLVEGTIPAFYSDDGTTAKLVVPFSMNRAVSPIQVKGIAIKIKTVQSSTYLYDAILIDNFYFNLENSPWAEFHIPVNKFRQGQFYKVQIAYINAANDEVGYFSSVGITKYTSKPELYIRNITQGPINSHLYEYQGIYRQSTDSTERVYSYRFDIYDPDDNLYLSSGDLIHNHDNDDKSLNESYDVYVFSKDLEIGGIYKIQYTITTVNKLTLSTPRYRIMQKPSIDPEINAHLNVELSYDNGYIAVNLIGELDENGMEEPVTGAFLLSRSCEDSNYQVWDEVSRFKLAGQIPSRQLWKDFTVEQGKHYQYSLQQYNDAGLYSNRMLSDIIYSDFEDAFLFDGKKQLKIKYNPKVSSLKKDLLETKTDTIGGKHPFIFRNGRVYYTEFPISGLISYQMDEENLFLSEEEYLLTEKTTNLVSENLASERIFKLKVLEWLTNGETKVFRSPGEGNYIVRLMNSSLAPNDTLGRMLHTFSSTAYEVADFTYKNLNDMHFISIDDPEVPTLRWETAMFYNIDNDGRRTLKETVNEYEVYTARFSDLTPGDIITLYFANGKIEEVQIGVTGSYYIDSGVAIRRIKPGREKESITDSSFSSYNASITYSYYSVQSNVFDKIENVTVTETSTHQFIGEHNIINEIECIKVNGLWSKNPKIDIMDIYHLTLHKRQVVKLVLDNNKYYYGIDSQDEFNPELADPFTIYAIGSWETPVQGSEGPGYRPGYKGLQFVISGYMDFYNNVWYEGDSYNPKAQINNQLIDINEVEIYEISKPGRLNIIEIGNGVVAEISYQIRNIDYRIESDSTYHNLVSARSRYDNSIFAIEQYYNEIATDAANDAAKDNEAITAGQNLPPIVPMSEEDAALFNTLQLSMENAYTDLIIELIAAQIEEKKAEGLL